MQVKEISLESALKQLTSREINDPPLAFALVADFGAIDAFTEAMPLSKRREKGVIIPLEYRHISVTDLKERISQVDSLEPKNPSHDFRLNLTGNAIDAEGAKKLAEAVQSVNCSGCKITLISNTLGSDAALCLADYLKTGNCAINLNLDFAIIDSTAAKSIIEAIVSGKSFPKLSISIANSKIGDEFIEILAAAIETGNCPAGLNIHFSDDSIEFSADAINTLLKALPSKNCPADLCISYKHRQIQPEHISALEEIMKKNTTCIFNFYPATERMEAINKRNMLFKKYPHRARLIKSVFHQQGLYVPTFNEKTEIGTLEEMTAQCIYNNPKKIGVNQKNPPLDILNFMEEVKNINQEIENIRKTHIGIGIGIALYSFEACGENELSFKQGDKITILDQAPDWSLGKLNGRKGYIPTDYLELTHRKSNNNVGMK